MIDSDKQLDDNLKIVNIDVTTDIPLTLINEQNTEKKGLIQSLKAKKGIWGVLGGVLLVLLKFKGILFLLLSKLKFLLIILKLGKFASTFISMFVMIAVYASIYGWSFAVGFVLLLFVHEMGHYVTAKKLNLSTSLPLFIPFVGALISLKEEPKDAVIEAKMAIGGPAAGSFGAFVCVLLYFIFNHDVFLALAYIGFMLNLFNLIPVHPMDGGRVVSAISPLLWAVGIIIAAIVAMKNFNPILIMILVLGSIQFFNTWKNPDKSYYKVDSKTRLVFAVAYFGLLMVLGASMAYIHSFHADLINNY
jgi:Zn-dependent protease